MAVLRFKTHMNLKLTHGNKEKYFAKICTGENDAPGGSSGDLGSIPHPAINWQCDSECVKQFREPRDRGSPGFTPFDSKAAAEKKIFCSKIYLKASLKLSFKYLFNMHMSITSVLSAWASVNQMYDWYPQRPQEGVDVLELELQMVVR